MCHNACDVLSSLWHKEMISVWAIDTVLEVLSGTSEAPRIICRIVSVRLYECECTCIFLQMDHCLTWKVRHVDRVPAELSAELESEKWGFLQCL